MGDILFAVSFSTIVKQCFYYEEYTAVHLLTQPCFVNNPSPRDVRSDETGRGGGASGTTIQLLYFLAYHNSPLSLKSNSSSLIVFCFLHTISAEAILNVQSISERLSYGRIEAERISDFVLRHVVYHVTCYHVVLSKLQGNRYVSPLF